MVSFNKNAEIFAYIVSYYFIELITQCINNHWEETLVHNRDNIGDIVLSFNFCYINELYEKHTFKSLSRCWLKGRIVLFFKLK